MLVVAMLLCPSTSWTTLVSTPFSSSRVAYPWRRLWGVAESIPAAWAAAAKVRLSVPRPTGLVAARVGNSQRGLLWVVHNPFAKPPAVLGRLKAVERILE